MIILTILEKNEKTKLKFSQGSFTVLWKMVNYQSAIVKLTNTQLNELKSESKNKTRTILRINKKNQELFYQLVLTATQTTRIRNFFLIILKQI